MKKLSKKAIFLSIFIVLIISGIIGAIALYINLIIEDIQPGMPLDLLRHLPYPIFLAIIYCSTGYIFYLFMKNLDYIIDLEEKVVERTKELTEANQRLKELDRLKSMFVASVSHELRTPLTSIIGFTRMILKGWVGEINEEQENQLTIVLKNANSLHQLINDVIDISKIEADKLDIRKESYNLVDELLNMKESFIITTGQKGIGFHMETPESLMIFNDKQRINQILINLIGNAIKFTDEGEVSVSIQRTNGNVEISVEDSGPGIIDKDLEKLFEPFSRIIEPGRFKEGTGLGLQISKKLANLLGGDIFVESEFEKGSTFTLSLKLEEEESSK